MTDKTKQALKRALDRIEGNGKYDAAKRIAQAIREALAEQPAIKQDLTPEQPEVWVTPKLRPLAKLAHEQHQCKFPMCHNEEYQQALAEQIKRELYTGEPEKQQELVKACVTGQCPCKSECDSAQCCLYTSPPAQPQQEPVAWYCKEGLNQGVSLKQESPDWEPLYTTKFNFKPLTDEEADELVRRFARYELLRAIEAKLKEKNSP